MSEQFDDHAISLRLEHVRERVRRAAETAARDPASITVLAVTKGHAVGAVEAAASVGLVDVGESRVQEAQAKRAAYAGGPVSWHMIGHLQRNKARAAAALFDAVHSVDSVALASALADARPADQAPLRVYVEVELTGIPTRSGVAPGELAAVFNQVRAMSALQVEGLMTIAPAGPSEPAAACFARLRELRDKLSNETGMALDGLSMGMSDDFEIAIAHGATIVRLGRVLFGERRPSGT